jgi:hypothetical protein
MSHERLIFDRCRKAGFSNFLAKAIVAQSKHETAIHGVPYMSRQFIVNNNAFGYGRIKGDPDQIGDGGLHGEGDGGHYAKYQSLDKCMNDVIQWYTKRIHTFSAVNDLTGFANGLKNYHYYTAPVSEYANGLNHYYSNVIT